MIKGGNQASNNLDGRGAEIARDKVRLLNEFDDGAITFREFFERLDEYQKQDVQLILERDRRLRHARHGLSVVQGTLLLALAAVSFAFGPYAYAKLFDYANAEECVLKTPHRWAVGACYDLYPTMTESKLSKKNTAIESYSQGLAARELASAQRSATDERYIPVPLEPMPANGEVAWFGAPRAVVAPLEIKSSPGASYLVKLTDANGGGDVMTIFVVGGKTANVKVPLGNYVIKYVSGSVWYGYQLYFGPNGSYARTEKTFEFMRDSDGVTGYKVTLYAVQNGNLKTNQIEAKDF